MNETSSEDAGLRTWYSTSSFKERFKASRCSHSEPFGSIQTQSSVFNVVGLMKVLWLTHHPRISLDLLTDLGHLFEIRPSTE